MAPRKRSSKNKGLESIPNLYARVKNGTTYYEYVRPDTKKAHGMGTDRQKAMAAARQLNSRFMAGQDLIARVVETAGKLVGEVVDEFARDKVDSHPALSDGTKREKTYRLNRIKKDLGSDPISGLSTLQIVQWLDGFSGDSYRQHRTVINQLFDFAITRGYRKTNPVTPTETRDLHYKKSRRRLTKEQFKKIREAASPWFQIAMDAALLLCQGRNEIAALKFSDIKDKTLYIIRKKVEKHESSRLAIAVSPALDELLARAKALPPLSPYVVHKHLRTGRLGQIKPEMLTREFKRLRDSLDVFARVPPGERPTFHEIRALGGKLLEDGGWEKEQIQRLMAHADAEMTEVYLAGHDQIKWVQADAGNVVLW